MESTDTTQTGTLESNIAQWKQLNNNLRKSINDLNAEIEISKKLIEQLTINPEVKIIFV